MASITIRNLNRQIKARLRLRAARNSRSMEEEARNILRESLAQEPGAHANLAESIRSRFAALGGIDLPVPPREAMREPPAPGK